MSQHPRNSQSKKKQALPKRCLTRPTGNRVQKKTKKISSSSSSPSNNARPKRLSGLTATTLLRYCTNLLSPKSNERTATKQKKERPSPSTSPPAKKVKVRSTKEENEPPSPPARTRREASSRASALILQQNEIERSRFNFPLAQESNPRRLRRSKSPVPLVIQPEPFQFHIPAPPPPPLPVVTPQYPPLTEALLAEHDRRLGTIPSYHSSKRENLLKWTEGLEAFDHFSPSSPIWDDKEPAAIPIHRSLSFSFEQTHRPLTNSPYPSGGPTFLAPSSASSNYPLDFSSFYSHPLLPCWQYPGKPQK